MHNRRYLMKKKELMKKLFIGIMIASTITGCATIQKNDNNDLSSFDTFYKTSTINDNGKILGLSIVSNNEKTYITTPKGVLINKILIDNNKSKFIKIGPYWIANKSGYNLDIYTNIGEFKAVNNSNKVLTPSINQNNIKSNNTIQNSINISRLKTYTIPFNENSSKINLEQVNVLATIPLNQNISVTSCARGGNYQTYIMRGMKVTSWLINHNKNGNIKIIFNGLNKNCKNSNVEVSLG